MVDDFDTNANKIMSAVYIVFNVGDEHRMNVDKWKELVKDE